MLRLGGGGQDLGPDDEEEETNRERRWGASCFFADDDTTAAPPLAATTTARRRPFSATTSRRRRGDVGRKGGASARGEQPAACVRGGRCCAPRTAALLRTVQRGDYGTLAKLLSQSNSGRDEQAWSADTGMLGALLIEASGREHLDCMELLIQSMACKPKRHLKRQGYYPMHTAAGAGTLESVELLISAGLSPKTRDQGGRTPLHHASAHGSAECVSFLCVIAGSTLLSHDKGAGDTPLHFAVRAGHSVCAEVLLSHAREDLLHATNSEGETPLDVARAVGDETLWRALQDGDRRRHHALTSAEFLRSGFLGDARATRSELGGTVVDVGRIMAVWERFFENAALVAVGSGLAGVPDGATEDRESRQSRPRAVMRGVERESNGMCKLNDNGEAVETVTTHRGLATTINGWGCVVGDSSWSKDRGDCRTVDQSNLESQEARRPEIPDALTATRTRFCAWGTGTDDSALDRNNYPDLPPIEVALHRTGNLPTQVVGDTNDPPCSDDADLFQTPNGGSGDWVWPTDDRQGEIQSSFEISVNTGAMNTDEATFGRCQPHRGWVTCWDADSESVYYWDLESGSSTWDVTTVPPGAMFSSGVWDPQQEAFFAVDESGASHWLVQTSPASSIASSDERWKGAGTANTLATVGAEDRLSSARSQGPVPHPSQELEMVMSPSSEGNDSFHAALSEEEVYPGGESRVGGEGGVGLEFPAGKQSHRSARQLVESQGHYDDACGLLYAQEQSSYHASMPQEGVAEDGWQPAGVTDHAGNFVGTRSSSESARPTRNMGVQENVDGVDFFDSHNGEEREQSGFENTIGNSEPEVQPEQRCASNTIEAESTLAQLPQWLLWCAQPHDSTRYYVNEETGASAWVLPPEAVMSSGGWLRAWSEEHQAGFFANHWTGRSTWDSRDLEVDSD